MYGPQARIPTAPEDGARAVAIPRATDGPTGPGDGESPQPAPGRRPATGRGAGPGSGFRSPDHCRSRSHRRNLSFRGMSLLVGRCLPGPGGERRGELQPPISKGQPPHAALTQSDCERCGKSQRKHLRTCVSAFGSAPGAQSSHRGHCPPTVSPDMANPAPGSSLRRTGSRCQPEVQASAHGKNDPATPKTRLSDRSTQCSTPQFGTGAVIFDPAEPGRASDFS